MSKGAAEEKLFKEWAPDDYPVDKEFDPESIMMISIKPEWTNDNFSTQIGDSLSEKDKKFIAELYPGNRPSK